MNRLRKFELTLYAGGAVVLVAVLIMLFFQVTNIENLPAMLVAILAGSGSILTAIGQGGITKTVRVRRIERARVNRAYWRGDSPMVEEN